MCPKDSRLTPHLGVEANGCKELSSDIVLTVRACPWRILGILCLLLGQAGWLAGQTQQIEVRVSDRDGKPISGARIELTDSLGNTSKAETDPKGEAAFPQLPSGRYRLAASKDGFERLEKTNIELSEPGSATVDLTLVPALSQHDSIEVKATADEIAQGATTSAQISTKVAKELPSRPATVADALPLVPGVVRSPTGDLQISGAGEHRSSLIVNSADVTDPATGQFGLTVPIDSVESLHVFQTPFLAEYGRFSSGLVSVETRRGGDEWKWEINDPFPDFRIRSYHLRGLRDATPRLNVEGPLIKGKLYFSEGLEYEVRNIEIHTLPFPFNQTKKAGVNSFAQFDWIISPTHLLTATVHVAPQRMGFVNLDYFDPQPTVPDASTHNYTGTLTDRLTLAGGLLENTFSTTRFDAGVWSRGPQDLTIAPAGNSGNYFSEQSRSAWRVGWQPTYSFAPVKRWGEHNFKVGSYIARSDDDGEVHQRPVDVLNAGGVRLEQISFFGGRPFEMSDTEYAVFGQDHWTIASRLAADLGLRTESQVVSHSFRVAPRAGIAWAPWANTGTVVRLGFGFFYDRVPLDVYSFNHYPKEMITLFDPNGGISAGPFFYLNALGQVNTRGPWVFHQNVDGNFSPRAATGSLQIEQSVTRMLKLRVGYLRSISDGLVTMTQIAPDPVSNIGENELSGSGNSRYRQFELTARLQPVAKYQAFFSYVRNRAHGDLNEFSNYLGSFPQAIIRPNEYGRLPGDLPSRFLAWGTAELPAGFRIAPILEYRDGFAYSAFDSAQNYVGIPNHNRYPNFLSLDSRFSKDIKIDPKHTVRLSISSYNLTNHFNPEALHWNTGDQAFGVFFGSRGRRFTADFDVLF